MELVLTLEGGRGTLSEQQMRLRAGRLSIGRAADNDWKLPDPQRVLSNHHCLIERRQEMWVLTDKSQNGVYVGDSPSPLGSGRTVQLEDGHRLRLGDYVLAVRLVPETDTARTDSVSTDGAHERDNGSPFDRSWIQDRRLDLPVHPIPVEPRSSVIRHDHAPVDQEALKLLSWPTTLDDDALSPPAPLASEPPPLPQAPRSPPPTPAPATLPVADASRLLAVFLEGAGLTAAEARDDDPEAMLGELGRRYGLMVAGLVELLLIRATVKRETGLDRTMIAATGNNPLKLTANCEEAVRCLVWPRGAGYLPPESAITATVDDLKAFMPELAQAMQQALRNLLRRFDPKELEQALADTPLLQVLAAGGRKARGWDLFKERYVKLARQTEREFLREIGIDIGREGRGASWEGH